MKPSRKLLPTAIATAVTSLYMMGAQAQTPPTPHDHGGGAFAELDANGDGKVSRDEAAKHPRLAEHFDELDANKDGFLSKEELAAAMKRRMNQHLDGKGFAQIDTNGDGKISRDEAAKHPRLAEHFDELDTNKDGFLGKEELKAAAQKMHGHFQAEGFARMDTDGDGVISRAEAASHPRLNQHFDEIDTNKDGVLSRDELKAATQKTHGKS